MAFTSIAPIITPYIPNFAQTTPNVTSVTLNASADKVGFMFQVPKTGTLHSFEFRLSAVANNPDNGLRLSFQDISTTTGFPDGTQDQFRDLTGTLTAGWQILGGPITSDGTDVGTKRSVTKGDWLACVIEFVSFVASDNVTVSVMRNNLHLINQPLVADGSTGSYTDNANSVPQMALKYDDSTYGEFDVPCWPFNVINTYTYNNASTPDEYAMVYVPQAPVRVAGIWAYTNPSADLELVLYNSGGTALATYSHDPDFRSGSAAGPIIGRFATAQELTSGATYYLAVKPTSASNISLYTFEANAAAQAAGFPGGGNWYTASRTDAGSWTTNTAEFPMIGVIIDGIDDGAGGGSSGGSFPFVG